MYFRYLIFPIFLCLRSLSPKSTISNKEVLLLQLGREAQRKRPPNPLELEQVLRSCFLGTSLPLGDISIWDCHPCFLLCSLFEAWFFVNICLKVRAPGSQMCTLPLETTKSHSHPAWALPFPTNKQKAHKKGRNLCFWGQCSTKVLKHNCNSEGPAHRYLAFADCSAMLRIQWKFKSTSPTPGTWRRTSLLRNSKVTYSI